MGAASDASTTANAPGILIHGRSVSVFVPNSSDNSRKGGIGEATLESSPDPVPAPIQHRGAGVANSCAASAANNLVICSSVFGRIYETVPGNRRVGSFASGVHKQVHFTGGGCAACAVAVDDSMDRAIVATSGGYLPIQLPRKRLPMITTNGEPVSANFGYDPVNHWIISPNYNVLDQKHFRTSNPLFQIIQLDPTERLFDIADAYEFYVNGNKGRSTCLSNDGTTQLHRDELPDSAAIDTGTGIVYVSFRSRSDCTGPNTVEDIASLDMTQATFTPPAQGSPSGTWDTPGKQIETLSELQEKFANGITGIAVVSSQHLAIIADRREGGGGTTGFGALRLPSTSGSGIPSIVNDGDWVQADMPNDPSHKPWVMSYEPNGVTAYESPNSNRAFGVVMNQARSYVAVVDLEALLEASRSTAHTVAPDVDLVGQNIVRFVSLVPPRRRR